MYNIDEMIKQTKTMPNISEGGSVCYSFGDVVLVKYSMLSKYGIVRDKAEKVAKLANEKNLMGVRTPKHLAIKREIVEDQNICWVLQEKAEGVCFSKYARIKNSQLQILKQRELLKMKEEYLQRLAIDLKELMYAGIELKPKNIFIDTENGGFTIIDLLGESEQKEYSGTVEESLTLFKYMKSIFYQAAIYSYDEATDEERTLSHELLNQCKIKCFRALEEAIPKFREHRRIALRALTEEELNYFQNNGYEEDLTLTSDEEKDFAKCCDEIANTVFTSLANGEKEYWYICANDIRNFVNDYGLWQSYKFYKNNKFKKENYEDNCYYERGIQEYIEEIILGNVNQKVIEYVESHDSLNDKMMRTYYEIKARNNTI